ncbi:hypothetical protein GCM10025779_15100 [Arthrobacter cryoconiti]
MIFGLFLSIAGECGAVDGLVNSVCAKTEIVRSGSLNSGLPPNSGDIFWMEAAATSCFPRENFWAIFECFKCIGTGIFGQVWDYGQREG